MSRLVIFKDKEPKVIKIGEQTIKICRCGLSKNPDGYCDESHLITKDEDDNATYFYDDKLNREIVDMISDEEDFDCCGGGCCSHSDEDEEKDCCKSGSCSCNHKN